ncbi:M23 family metallopeptidase [Glycomyces tarimensis]
MGTCGGAVDKRRVGALGAAAVIALPAVVFAALLGVFRGGPPSEAWHVSATTVAGFEYECVLDDPETVRSGLAVDNGWRGAQADNAITVYLGARERGLDDRAAFVGLVAAYQSSRLYNYANFNVEESLEHDHDRVGDTDDAVGLFGQRPSDGWGAVRKLMNPESAARAFYDRLTAVDGWEDMAPAEAAQAVQGAASPDGYDRWEDYASQAIARFAERVSCVLAGGEWTHPVPGAPIWSSFRTANRPNHDGVDFGADTGTEILAARDGIVVRVRCNATRDGEEYSCDVDGSPEIRGCGWYVDIEHADATATRYCHMVSEPLVDVGDAVKGGQVIGHVGSSGNSSAPHLHFEVHTGVESRHSGEPVDPVPFMRRFGVDLRGGG